MSGSIPIFLVDEAQLKNQHSESQAWLTASGFKGEPSTFSLVPDGQGGLGKVLVGKPKTVDTWVLGNLPQLLPPQDYHLADSWSDSEATQLYLGWQLGQYRFAQYKHAPKKPVAQLIPPKNADHLYVTAATEGTFLARDLINTPANDMGPAHLEARTLDIAGCFGADFQVITGEDLLSQNYPLIHAVGRADDQAPRLIDFRWGDLDAPKVTLVGKGVCFDSGGLDIKNASGMQYMKKDMGGAAQVLGLALMIMKLQLPIRLRVLIPAVSNSISSNSMRPLDVLPSRRGITVEVGNTDAEGRLVLADALWEAVSEEPELLIDCATLTGAARVALGTELPAVFSNHAETANALLEAGQAVDDLLWQLPLHQAYRPMLDSKVADISNISSASYGGSITAALFLQEFVKPTIPWIHIDVMAWNLRSLPGRPEGGEAMSMRALFELIRQRFGKK
ncbi:leucyl aminopeptidase family protein [Pseudanabaena sp. FACHB-2040]|uniref:leucyl aminopeptidase family protein n=1 Tax=Pseudanabaena sp. FACHB-2040 TaxID=2692859 RepID=UPI0018F00CFB|nr:leucyl aminopeptidase family protein [Pseudanabaena sp. FACHB-2040]